MRKKSAFTIAEVIIFFSIVGIILIFAYSTFRNFDKGIKYIYSNTYHVLDRALYNAISFSELDDPFELQKLDANDQAVPVTPAEGTQRLCRLLIEYINTTSSNCNTIPYSDLGNNFNTPHFTAANGIKFYISTRMRGNNDEDPVFYIIYADINGDKRPNSMRYVPGSQANGYRTVDPDIFAFAALDIARVCPLGPPEVDMRYLQTRIAFDQVENGQAGADTVRRYTEVSKPYVVTKAEAWGYYLNDTNVNDNLIIDETPYSYNGYIRNNISNNSLIYSFLGNRTLGSYIPAGTELQSNQLGCTAGSDEICDVIVNRYVY